ncbi:hybrid sensor histidine kinase/response regulator transcription factor [Telluribacter sp.]|jgi:signal transduction histidine kinase/ligand-binding sensor domain-containing protein/DNA-binding response OmpR family regulator|uniref:hybrid sensor histidine kinase/response regulator transcription factor n=1 Tax=Telluribacter sp. TaxID=1978767 RepID=UPI002E13B391|nr:two-component regulator propeller domain-containing protein [Telluribacter sp.]
MNRFCGYVLLLAFDLIATIVQGQSVADQYRFDHITVNDGLAHSDAMCAEQDAEGFLWIGTNDGINRYNGYELKKYSLPINTRSGLSGNRIRDLYTDAQNRLWVGAEGAGLSLFDAAHDRFINVSQLARSSVNHALMERLQLADVEVISADQKERIWVGTRSDGLFVLVLNTANQLIDIRQIGLSKPSDVTFGVSSLAADRDGTIWIGTLSNGLWSIGAGQPSLPSMAQTAPLATRFIRALHLDRQGNLWIGTNQQILWVSQDDRLAQRSFSQYSLPQPINEPQCIYVDSFGHLWVGTNAGLHLWEPRPASDSSSRIPVLPDRHRLFLPENASSHTINSGRVEQIFEDRNQIIWFSTPSGGLNKLNLWNKPFTNLQRQATSQPTLADNAVNAILKDEARNWLWIGTRNGFSRYDLTTKTYRNYLSQSLPGYATGVEVSAFCRASDGTLWVSTRYSGLITLKDDQLHTQTVLPDGFSLRTTRLESIVEDRFATIWVATFDKGLLRFDRQGRFLQRFNTENSGLPTNRFTFLLYDSEKDLMWASTHDAGVLKLKLTPKSLQVQKQFSYRANDSTSLSVNYAWPLLKDHQGRLWIGTIGGGLNLLTVNAKGQEVIQRFSHRLPLSDVESLLEDETGHLWLAGTGLLRVNPATGQWVSYVVADGIQSNSFKVGAAWRAADGTLFFGGVNGVTYFQPRFIKPNPYAPVVHLTGLRIFNKLVEADKPVNGHMILTRGINGTKTITLRASENDFSLDFVGLHYANTRKHSYAYRLIGYNDGWITAAPGQRSASFANLPAGDYTFVVKASNGEGKWSTKPATLKITITPAWYRTGLAYGMYILLIIGALLLYRHITLTQQRLENNLALEKFQAEKEREVTDIKLRFFTGISHELRTPLTLILGPMEEMANAKSSFPGFKEKMDLVQHQTRKLLNLVNQLMEFRKVETGNISLRASRDDIVAFVNELFMIFRFKAQEQHIDYAIEVPVTPVPMYFDRDKLEIILTNLMANALKYTPEGGKIRLFLSVVGLSDEPAVFKENKLIDNYIQLVVRDWGVGMNPMEIERIFDSYYQASHTETMHIMGTGIGLSLVKQFVEAHAGEVAVTSEPDVGTEFTLRLPFGQAHLSQTDIVDEPPTTKSPALVRNRVVDEDETSHLPKGEANLGASRILVVEDNDELRQYLQQLLAPAYTVFTAVDGVDGWEKTLSLLPSLVISDIMMPRSDGLTLCRKIKQNLKTQHIPVILLTARVAAVHELEGLETGADEYMAKPFDLSILHAKIASILRGRHQLKEYYQRQILLKPTDIVIPNAERQLLEKAMRIIEANMHDSAFNVQTLVREMGMSQSSFYRQIKAITGQPVVKFIKDVRMKRAAQLLATGQLRVSEVAAQVGMDDLNYFRKTFQGVFILSPSDYAKQHSGIDENSCETK